MLAEKHTVPFIGRADELKRVTALFERSEGATLLCVHGPGGIGKTRFLQELVELGRGRAGAVVTNILDFDMLYLHIGGSLIRELARQLGREGGHFQPYDEAVAALAEAEHKPSTTAEDHALYYEQTLRAFERCYKALTGERPLFILMDTVEKTLGKEAEDEIVRLLQIVSDTRSLVVLSGRSITYEDGWSRLLDRIGYERVERLELPPLNEQESLAYLHEKELALHIVIEPSLQARLVQLAGGWPMKIDLICQWVARNHPLPWLVEASPEELQRLASEKKDELDAALVGPIHTPPTTLNQVLLYMAYVFPMEPAIWSRLLKIDPAEEESLGDELGQLVFVKVLPDGTYTLHDEMRDMVEQHIWKKRDPQGLLRQRISERMTDYYAAQAEHWRAEVDGAAEGGAASTLARETLKQQYWLARVRQLLHLCQWDLQAGYTLFKALLAEARHQYNWPQYEALIEQVLPHKARLNEEQQYWLALRHVDYLLSDEYFGSSEKTKDTLDEMLRSYGDEGHRTVNILSKLYALMIKDANYAEAVRYTDKALAICRDRLPEQLHWFYSNRGWAYRQMGDLENARMAYKEALEQPFSDDRFRSDVSNNLGFVECLRGVYNAAWVHCKKALKMRQALLEQSQSPDERVEIQKRIGLSYSTLGDISRFTGQYEQALNWLNQAVETFEATGDRAKLALVCTKLGATLSTAARDEKDYLLAEAVLKKALSLGANKEEAHTLHVLGCVYRDQGDLEGGLELFRQSEAQDRGQQVSRTRLNNLLAMAEIYYRQWQASRDPSLPARILKLAERFNDESDKGVRLFHHSARMERLRGDLAFDEQRYDTARHHYAKAFANLGGRRGGYGKRSFEDEIEDLGARIRQLPPKVALDWCAALEKHWTASRQQVYEFDELLAHLDDFRSEAQQRMTRAQ